MINIQKQISNLAYKYPIKQQTDDFVALKNVDKYFEETFIIVDAKLKELIKDFILFKIKYGSEEEKVLFKKFITDDKKIKTTEYIQRLYECRPVVFYGRNDMTLDRKGNKSYKQIGSKCTDDYLGYDEIEIASLLSISIYTPFINDGARDNKGQKMKDIEKQEEGIMIGQVGSRFEVEHKMEYRTMVISQKQNTEKNGYGPQPLKGFEDKTFGLSELAPFYYNQIWAKFYNVPYFPTFEQVSGVKPFSDNCCADGPTLKDYMDHISQYIKLGSYYFNTIVYKNRTKYLANQFLKEASRRAQWTKKYVYCYVVGLGLGAWLYCEEQRKITIESYLELLRENKYPGVKELYFGYIKPGQTNSINGIKIRYGTKNPSEPLKDPNGLLVCNWAFDGNSYIGNEYFLGHLDSSGDPSAACSSYIAYIGNPEINKNVRVMVL